MNWSSLLPSTFDPLDAFRRMLSADPHGLRDFVILIALGLIIIFGLKVVWQTLRSRQHANQYLKALKASSDPAQVVMDSKLPHFKEMSHHLIDFPGRDGTRSSTKRRSVDAAEVFREADFAPAFCSSRLVLAIPAILTGLGVLGTFIGLQLGIGSLNLKDPGNLDKSIVPLIEGCAVAFSSSVWGVGASVLFSLLEKACEGFSLGPIRKLQNAVDALFPRYVPEEAMSELEKASRGTEDLLKGLAVAIGAEMQTAIKRLGSEIKDAVSNATAEGHGPMMEKSAELLSSALTAELVKLKEQIGNMAEQFAKSFTGASDDLMKSVQGFQPTVTALSSAVGDMKGTVGNAVEKLNAHGDVMLQMSSAASNIKQAAEAFAKMKETLTLSASQNEDAAKAQLTAAKSNEQVADHFGRIGERLPEMRDTLEKAAEVISSITGPIASLKDVLDNIEAGTKKTTDEINKAATGRDKIMTKGLTELADKVGAAAAEFSKLEGLADKLAVSAASLDKASKELGLFGSNVSQASKAQQDASVASREAAASGERTAKALEPIPAAINKLTSGLESAGSSVRSGAEAAGASYKELQVLQKQWFAGAELGLRGMKDQLQAIIKSYGDQIDGQTSNLMKRWTEEVESCLGTYSSQVDALQGGLDELQSAISKLPK